MSTPRGSTKATSITPGRRSRWPGDCRPRSICLMAPRVRPARQAPLLPNVAPVYRIVRSPARAGPPVAAIRGGLALGACPVGSWNRRLVEVFETRGSVRPLRGAKREDATASPMPRARETLTGREEAGLGPASKSEGARYDSLMFVANWPAYAHVCDFALTGCPRDCEVSRWTLTHRQSWSTAV